MNEKNKILLGCLALLLVLSVGYALFSETITINGTATAKGSFELTTTCERGYSATLVNAGIYASTDDGQTGFDSDSCSVIGNSVSMTTSLNYPGATRFFTVKITNSGTIDAIVDSTKVTDGKIYGNNVIEVCPLLEDGTVSTECTETLKYESLPDGHVTTSIAYSKGFEFDVVSADSNGVVCDFDDDCISNYVTEDGEALLKPGDSFYFKVGLFWPRDYVSGYDYGFKISGSLDIPFVQVTAQ